MWHLVCALFMTIHLAHLAFHTLAYKTPEQGSAVPTKGWTFVVFGVGLSFMCWGVGDGSIAAVQGLRLTVVAYCAQQTPCIGLASQPKVATLRLLASTLTTHPR